MYNVKTVKELREKILSSIKESIAINKKCKELQSKINENPVPVTLGSLTHELIELQSEALEKEEERLKMNKQMLAELG